MLEIVLVPVIKDKTGRIDQVDNYRPIALANVISKVVELILLSRISGLLETCHCDDVDNGLDNTCEVKRQETVLFSTPVTDYIIYD